MCAIKTVFHSLAENAAKYPDKPAVICGARSLNYAELAKNVNAVANGLVAAGVTPGSRVGISTNEPIDHLIGAIAAMAAGAGAVALPNADRTAHLDILRDAVPSVVIHAGEEISSEPNSSSHGYSIEQLVGTGKRQPADLLKRQVAPDELAMIYYTSGTSSGVRKGVMQSYGQLHHTAHYIVDAMRLTADVCEFVASSLDNAFWFGRCRCVLKVGGTLLLHGGTLNPLGILGAVTRHNGNAISGDTPVFLLLMNHLEKNLRRVAPQLRWIKIASQAMPLKDKIHATALLPNARIVMGYGLTEAMRTCLLAFGDHPDKLATDGRPCPGVRIQSVNEQGQPLAPTEVGEILISGVNLATGYWGKAEMWAEKFDGEWYKSGDLGYIDADGFLTLLGRKDQAINSGGKTIALSEVESRLRERILSTSFAVCGVPDKRNVLGDVIALCVEGKWNESKDWKDLRIELFENMDPALIPKDAYVFDAFPRTTNGKIQVIKLRESIEAGTAEKI